MEKKVSLTHKITDEIAIKINEIINGNYQQAALGTIDDTGFPMVTKVIPMNYNDIVYLLISDLSEHTKNLNLNPNASLYFAQKEKHKIKSNSIESYINWFTLFKIIVFPKFNPIFLCQFFMAIIITKHYEHNKTQIRVFSDLTETF